MQYLQSKTVLILGLGVSGLATARWCNSYAQSVLVVDSQAQPKLLPQIADLPKVKFIHNQFSSDLLTQVKVDLIVVSPGIAPANIANLIATAQQQSIPVVGELWLFAKALKQLTQDNYQPKLIAITGTNGKTTVTSLTEHILRSLGKSVQKAGNIGIALLDALAQALQTELPEYWVVELSSFQLHFEHQFEPTVAVVLNVAQDHLDWHGSFDSYLQDKLTIMTPQTINVINRDAVNLITKFNVSVTKQISFGTDVAINNGDFGLVEQRDMLWLVVAQQNNLETELKYLMPVNALQITGLHNASNALASLALLSAVGIKAENALAGLRSYRGESHRTQFVALHNDVQYYNDSKATNVSATLAALRGMAHNNNIVLLLGGLAKGQDFTALVQQLPKACRAVILFGQDASLIEQSMQQNNINLPVFTVFDMQQAVNTAASQAKAGDVVLLSPACASLDMFSDYVQRGHAFSDAVLQLTQGG